MTTKVAGSSSSLVAVKAPDASTDDVRTTRGSRARRPRTFHARGAAPKLRASDGVDASAVRHRRVRSARRSRAPERGAPPGRRSGTRTPGGERRSRRAARRRRRHAVRRRWRPTPRAKEVEVEEKETSKPPRRPLAPAARRARAAPRGWTRGHGAATMPRHRRRRRRRFAHALGAHRGSFPRGRRAGEVEMPVRKSPGLRAAAPTSARRVAGRRPSRRRPRLRRTSRKNPRRTFRLRRSAVGAARAGAWRGDQDAQSAREGVQRRGGAGSDGDADLLADRLSAAAPRARGGDEDASAAATLAEDVPMSVGSSQKTQKTDLYDTLDDVEPRVVVRSTGKSSVKSSRNRGFTPATVSRRVRPSAAIFRSPRPGALPALGPRPAARRATPAEGPDRPRLARDHENSRGLEAQKRSLFRRKDLGGAGPGTVARGGGEGKGERRRVENRAGDGRRARRASSRPVSVARLAPPRKRKRRVKTLAWRSGGGSSRKRRRRRKTVRGPRPFRRFRGRPTCAALRFATASPRRLPRRPPRRSSWNGSRRYPSSGRGRRSAGCSREAPEPPRRLRRRRRSEERRRRTPRA